MRLIWAILLVALSQGAFAREVRFDPRDWRGRHAGPPTEVLTIGTVHLAKVDTAMTPAMLGPLLEKLAAFRPAIITHEGIAGAQCEILKRDEPVYPGVWEPYCWGADEARAATGLSIAQATVEIEKTLEEWSSDPPPATRRRLASLFLASNDRHSAQVQWRRLPEDERRIGDGIDAALLEILTRAGAGQNESYEIAVALAVRLGLERVYAVDYHTADAVRVNAKPGLGAAIQHLYDQQPVPAAIKMAQLEAGLKNGTDVLDYYRYLNRPATGRALVTAEYGMALKLDTPEQFGRQHVACWEIRNLRMVSNVRASFADKPGTRVLNIVGAAHKPYYDAYLGMMSDVRTVDAGRVLR